MVMLAALRAMKRAQFLLQSGLTTSVKKSSYLIMLRYNRSTRVAILSVVLSFGVLLIIDACHVWIVSCYVISKQQKSFLSVVLSFGVLLIIDASVMCGSFLVM
jgi:hypothetical protein